MGKKLITVEKPSVARDFATALGAKMVKEGGATYFESDQYIIVNCFGHMLESLSPEEYNESWKEWSIGVLAPPQFKKKIPSDKKAQTSLIIKLIKDPRIDSIVNAGDAGREGEIIQRELYEYAGTSKPIYRFWTSDELTSTVIKATLNKLIPSKQFDGLGYAGDARERSDWIIGLSGTRSMTKAFAAPKEVLSVGRVQTAILGLIVRRELAILNFKPRNFWNVVASDKVGSVSAKAVAPESADGDRFAFWKEEDAKNVMNDVKGKPYTVDAFDSKEVKENPPRPFSMPTLQQECSKLFGYSAEKTVDVAQLLYEKKYTTYPRTDSDYLGDEQKHSISGRVKAITSKSLFSNTKIVST
ncbi:MAG: DNA topoisomerase, partial [Epsilonproteobacteria bacterium]|nr:DNA topoisomerase [Campylobacterota bacterium]